jgi:type II secretory pathway component PulC
MTRCNLRLILNLTCALLLSSYTQTAAKDFGEPQTQSLKMESEESVKTKKQELDSLLGELKLKNPFSSKRFRASTDSKEELELQGIMRDGQKPFAVIDGMVVKEGDFIEGKKVIKIGDESVILDNHGQEEILKIKLKWR